MTNPAVPLSWPSEQKGMQGGQELTEPIALRSELEWLFARNKAVQAADKLHILGLHKSVINRLLEPFQYVTSIISATDWKGFWDQRDSELAQPEIREAARAMRAAVIASTPQRLKLGDWHLPYITSDDYKEAVDRKYDKHKTVVLFKMISAARCARVSYLTHDGKRSWDADLDLYEKLVTALPPHKSPLEHVATPSNYPTSGNFDGWAQLRHERERRTREKWDRGQNLL